jgi:hypothetical protein
MHLHEVIAGLSDCSAESLIFAERIGGDFRPESAAVVLELSEAELERPVREVSAEKAPGMDYFLEVFLARDMLFCMRGKITASCVPAFFVEADYFVWWPFTKRRILFQSRRVGLVRRPSQFLRVPKLTPR